MIGEFVVQPSEIEVSNGENLMLQCEGKSLPAARYAWTKDATAVEPDGKTILHGK